MCVCIAPPPIEVEVACCFWLLAFGLELGAWGLRLGLEVAQCSGAICVRNYFPYMDMVGVCSASPILVKNNPKFGVPKIIRLRVIGGDTGI